MRYAPQITSQSKLRHHIANLELLQEKRIALVAERKADMDASIERAQLELENLKTQQTIVGVR